MNTRIATFLTLLFILSDGFSQPWLGVYIAGTTYTPIQHNGSCGRMIGVDSLGFIQVVWTNALSAGQNPRHVYYNVWDPEQEAFTIGGGSQINSSSRAGYVTLAVKPNGFCFPAYHTSLSENTFSTVGFDFLPHTGAFTSYAPDLLVENNEIVQMLWPKIAIDREGYLHMVSAESPLNQANPARLFYSSGTPVNDGFDFGIEWATFGNAAGYAEFDAEKVLSHDIACSKVSGRMARAWIKPQNLQSMDSTRFNNDVYIQLSEDGGQNWFEQLNITQFIQPSDLCFQSGQDWRCCDRDTLRPFTDLTLLFDDNDNLHVAFTTVAYYHKIGEAIGPFVKPNKAQIWHWSETNNAFSPVAMAWYEDSLLSNMQRLQSQHAMVERPSLSINRQNGYLYCSYLQYDTSQYSTGGFMNADVFTSISADGGETWSVGTNITNSHALAVPATCGQNRSEKDLSCAEDITTENGEFRLHMFYMMDKNMGALESDLFVANDMIYGLVNAEHIFPEPHMPNLSFHVEPWRCDSMLNIVDLPPTPTNFELFSAYPNPFNSSTRISFDLQKTMNVELKIFDVTGRTVEVLQSGRIEAGHHELIWNADKFSSGIYFVNLRVENLPKTQKIFYLR